MVAATLAAALSFATVFALRSAPDLSSGLTGASSSATGAPTSHVQPALTHLAARDPSRAVEVIIQLQPAASPSAGDALVTAAGGKVLQDLPIIHGLGARM